MLVTLFGLFRGMTDGVLNCNDEQISRYVSNLSEKDTDANVDTISMKSLKDRYHSHIQARLSRSSSNPENRLLHGSADLLAVSRSMASAISPAPVPLAADICSLKDRYNSHIQARLKSSPRNPDNPPLDRSLDLVEVSKTLTSLMSPASVPRAADIPAVPVGSLTRNRSLNSSISSAPDIVQTIAVTGVPRDVPGGLFEESPILTYSSASHNFKKKPAKKSVGAELILSLGNHLSKTTYFKGDLETIDVKYCSSITKWWNQTLEGFCSESASCSGIKSRELRFKVNDKRAFAKFFTEYLGLVGTCSVIQATALQPISKRKRNENYGDMYQDHVSQYASDNFPGTDSKKIFSVAFAKWVTAVLFRNPGSGRSKFRMMFALFHQCDFDPEELVKYLYGCGREPAWIVEACKYYLAIADRGFVTIGVDKIKKLKQDMRGTRDEEIVEISTQPEAYDPSSHSVRLSNGRIVTRPRINAGSFDPAKHGYFFYWGTPSFIYLLGSIHRSPGVTIPPKLVQFITARVISMFTHLRVIRQKVVENFTVRVLDCFESNHIKERKPYVALRLFDSKRKKPFFRAFPIFFARIIRHYIDNVRPITEPHIDNLFVHYDGSVIRNYSEFTKTHYKLKEPYVRHSMKRKGNVTANEWGKSSAHVDTGHTAEHSERTAAKYYIADHEGQAALRLQHELNGERRFFMSDEKGIPEWWAVLMYPVLVALQSDEYDFRKSMRRANSKRSLRKRLFRLGLVGVGVGGE